MIERIENKSTALNTASSADKGDGGRACPPKRVVDYLCEMVDRRSEEFMSLGVVNNQGEWFIVKNGNEKIKVPENKSGQAE